jgi:predicted permease
MRIPLRRGRFFTDQDAPDRPRVVIVDQRMADELWPNQDPIGRRIRAGDIDSTAPWLTVVGVVGTVKQYGLDTGGRIAFYFPQTQFPARSLYVTVRSGADPASLSAAVVREVHALDPDLPVARVQVMDRWVEQSLARQRFSTALLAAFAGVALLLAAIGIYGVTTYLVAQSTREIGIRLALGASQRVVLGQVLREGMTVAVSGAATGLAGALALARLMDGLLFGVHARDPLTFAAVAGGLLAVALVATYLPARRAARVDPLVALRAD